MAHRSRRTSQKSKSQRGASFVECALLISLVAIAAMVGMRGAGVNVTRTLENANKEIRDASVPVCPICSP